MLDIRNLSKIYPGPVQALDGINLSLGPGMFGLLGPNGAGKTTLMRILAGLLEPTTGEVHLDQHNVTNDPAFLQQRLGYLPQEFGFFSHLDGQSMLLYLLRLKGLRGSLPDLARILLDRVHLSEAANRPVSTYSGGMRQRLGVAQAIAGDPSLVIVDEPTAGLDPEERLRFYQILAELAEERTVLLSTHIVEDVAVLCPRFAIIRRGRLLMCTTPSEAKAAVAGRIFEASISRTELPELETRFEVTQSLLVEGRFKVRIFEPDGTCPPNFEPVEASLEDAYLVTAGRADEADQPPSLRGVA